MPELLLTGCAPVPLAHYLKALGIFRLVAEQKDPDVKGSWERDVFKLHSTLDREALVDFFLKEYKPTPVLAPWNGGSGFYYREGKTKEKGEDGKLKKTGVRSEKTEATKVLESFHKGSTARFNALRQNIEIFKRILKDLGFTEAPKGEEKDVLLSSVRSAASDDFLHWMDGAVMLTSDGADYPPLLGTGGNGGNMDFTSNFLLRLSEILDPDSAVAKTDSARWLEGALFGSLTNGQFHDAAIGQFFPGKAGGANASAGFDGKSGVNPWDYALMIEGAVLFAGAAVKRLEHSAGGAFAYPFCVRQSGIGYPSAARNDAFEKKKDAREMWLPIWNSPTGLSELRALLAEGRVHVRSRVATTGVDFVQAIAALGVDRGIHSFQRYGFLVRNGDLPFATPLDRVLVRRNARVDLLADIDQWYDRFRRKCAPSEKPPNSVVNALTALERNIMALCQDGSPARMSALLAALGRTQRAIARSSKWATDLKVNIKPVFGLRPQWLKDADDGSVEFRLAASLAGVRALLGKDMLHIREHLEPVVVKGGKERSWVEWADKPSNDVVWQNGDPIEVLNAVLARRVMRTQQAGAAGWQDRSAIPARLEDITAFIEGRTDDALLMDLLWGLTLVDWQGINEEQQTLDEDERAIPSVLYALLKLCFHPARNDEDAIPLMPDIARRAIQGDGVGATTVAARRLRASGLAPLETELPVSNASVRRTAAALLFPISTRDRWLLQRAIIHVPTNLQHA